MPIETRPFDPDEYLDTPEAVTEYLIAAFESGEHAVIADARDLMARLKAGLTRAFAAPDSTYRTLDAETVIGRGQHRSGGYIFSKPLP
jgi:DNA-binding phage protein